jgi:hypothetical protein
MLRDHMWSSHTRFANGYHCTLPAVTGCPYDEQTHTAG